MALQQDIPSSSSPGAIKSTTRGKQREAAISALIKSYQTKYSSKKDFFVSPSIGFVATDDYGSISVQAREEIEAGTLLLKLPAQERISTFTRDKTLKKVLQELDQLYQQHANTVISTKHDTDSDSNDHNETSPLKEIMEYGEIALAVILLYAYGTATDETNDSSILSQVLQTWPTLSELRGCCSIWEPTKASDAASKSAWELLRGTYTVELLRLTYAAHHFVLEQLVIPTLEKYQLMDVLTFPSTATSTSEEPMYMVREAYWHASYLVRSRAYEGQTKGNTAAVKRPEMMPLVDLINGLATSCSSLGRVNVQVDHSAKDGTTTVRALANNKTENAVNNSIEAGTELIVSYGDHSVTGFISRYGFCPAEMLTCQQYVTDDVLLRLPPNLGPPDRLQVWASQELKYPATPDEVEKYKCFLPNASLVSFSKQMQANTFLLMGGPGGGGTFSEGDILQTYYRQVPQLPALHQYLEMCHMASEQEIIYAVNTRQLKVEGASELHVSHLFQVLVDHTLVDRTDLDASNNALDLQCANAPDAPSDIVAAYRARIFQRDALAQWRHAFCQRHGFPSEHAETKYYEKYTLGKFKDHLFLPKLPKSKAPQCLLAKGGCRFCGRTIKLLSCGKCRVMKYCSKEHQKADWKYHKKLCDPLIGTGQ